MPARDRGVADGLPERSVGIRGRTRARIGNSLPVRRSSDLLEGAGHARSAGTASTGRRARLPAPCRGLERPARDGSPVARRVGPLRGRPHRGRRGSRGTRRHARKGVSPVKGGPERVHGSEARARLGLGSAEREFGDRMSWAMGCGSRAWRPCSPPVERAGSTGPGVGFACGAGPPEAGSGSRLPGGRRPSGGTRRVGETVGDRRARRSGKPREASGSQLSRPDNGTAQAEPWRLFLFEAWAFLGDFRRQSRRLACASRRHFHRYVGALDVPPGQHGANSSSDGSLS